MVTSMGTEYWYVQLPSGKTLRGERTQDAINRELNELVARGWEPVSMVDRSLTLGVMFKKVNGDE